MDESGAPLPRLRLARNLRALRQARRLSQLALADLSGLHCTYIGGIERGDRNLSIDNVGCLADASGLDATDLLHQQRLASSTKQGRSELQTAPVATVDHVWNASF